MHSQPRAPRRRRWQWVAVGASFAAAPAFAQPVHAPLPDLPVSRLERLTPAQPPALPVRQFAERAGLDARTLSLTFPRPLPIRDVLLVLVRDTPYSIVANADVGGTFVGELRMLTMRQALEAVLSPAGLQYAVSGTVIRVFPQTTETRLFEVDMLAVRRSWERGASGDGDGFRTSTDSDAYAGLDAGVRAMLSPAGRHHVDRRAGLVHVTDYPERLHQVGVYLERAQLRATRQIRLDVRVLQVWPARPSGLNLAALAAQPGSGLRHAADAPGGVLVDDPEAFVGALGAEGRVTVVASPQLVSMNNEPAYVRVQSEAGVEPASSRSAASPGLTLVVTPYASADGIVQMSISPRYTDAPAGPFVPANELRATTSEADVLVRVRDGQTVVLSGLPGRPPGSPEQGDAPGRAPRAELILLVTPALVTLAPVHAGPTGHREETR